MDLREFQRNLRRNKSEKTIRSYTNSLKRFKKWLGRKEPNSLNVDQYIQYLIDQKHTPHSVHSSFWAIKSYFKYLGEGDKLDGIVLPKIMIQYPKCATQEEIDTLLHSEKTSITDKTIIILLFACGLRVGELITLKVVDYNPEEKTLMVTTEKKRGGAIIDRMPIDNDYVSETLELYISKLPPKSKYLFSVDDIRPINAETIRYRLKRLCKIYGLRPLNPHSFRHAYGTQLAISGLSTEQISSALRQRSTTSAERYMHMTAMDLRGKLPNLISRPKRDNDEEGT